MTKKINEDNNASNQSNAVHWLDYDDELIMSSAVHTNDELDELLAALSESERVQALSSNYYNPSDLFVMLNTIIKSDDSVVCKLYSFDSDNDDIWCRAYAWSDKAYEARNNARIAWYEAGKPKPKKNY